MTTNDIIADLRAYIDPKKVDVFSHYFDTHTGEKDAYLGVRVPDIKRVAKKYYKDTTLDHIDTLLKDVYHEVRLTALNLLVLRFKKASAEDKKEIIDLYLSRTTYVNNWDLVDASAYSLLGEYLLDKDRSILYSLVDSPYVWERRIAVVATLAFTHRKEVKDAFAISSLLLRDANPYIHKAVGWVLREAGKSDKQGLIDFLSKHYEHIARVSLRYAIEHFDAETRKRYLQGNFS